MPAVISMAGWLCTSNKEELDGGPSLLIDHWYFSLLSWDTRLVHFHLKSVVTQSLWRPSPVFASACCWGVRVGRGADILAIIHRQADVAAVLLLVPRSIWSVWTQVHSSEHCEPAVTVNISSLIYMKTREPVDFLMFYTHILPRCVYREWVYVRVRSLKKVGLHFVESSSRCFCFVFLLFFHS